MKTVRFYHSAICPRCRVTSLLLGSILPDYPGIQIERVEYLTHLQDARDEGVRSIPTLVSDDKRLTGFLIGKAKLRAFLDSVVASAVDTAYEPG